MGAPVAALPSGLEPLIADVEGWLNPAEVTALYELARGCTGRGAIVEIGSWKGRSTICLAAGARAGGSGAKVYAVDPHSGSPEHHAALGEVATFDEFKANIERAGVADGVVPLVMQSTEAAEAFDEPVELVFIDGDHSYEAARADIDAWLPKVVEGGAIAVHDAFVYQGGPREAIRRDLLPHISDVHFAFSLFYARKRDRPTVAQKVHARMALAERNLRERYALRGRFRTG